MLVQEVLSEVGSNNVLSRIVLANEGVAGAYAVLPLGAFHNEVKTLGDLDLDPRQLNPEKKRGKLSEIVFLTGQADLLAEFRVKDFRKIVKAQYPAQGSLVHVLNWIFAVPCLTVGNLKDPAKTMRFVTHLRIHRPVYAHHPVEAEQHILGYLSNAITKRGCVAEIQAGMGWADFIVNGSFDPTRMSDFSEFLVDVYEASFSASQGDTQRRHPAFLRTLTLLGYRWPENLANFRPPELPDAMPAMFVRAEPGHLHDTVKYFKHAIDHVDARLIDGKSDVVILLSEPQPDLLARNLDLVNRFARHREEGSDLPFLQKLETHLVFRSPQERTDDSQALIAPMSAAPKLKCRCDGPRGGVRPVSELIPEELRNSISNLLPLFDAASKDKMSCCDILLPIRSAERGRDRLTSILERKHRERQDLDKEYKSADEENDNARNSIKDRIKLVHRQIKRQNHLFALWHLLNERVLRQRSIASFDEMLLQSDRAVVYRGSVQKFLFLADWLMKDFYGRIAGFHAPPIFAAMYEAEKQIESLSYAGLVRIPARHLFTLPFVIPDLWHEVGVYWFYRRVPPSAFELSADENEDRILEALGDRFGDLVVYQSGFHGDWRRFVVSACRGWLDSYDREKMSDVIYRDEFAALLRRLAFAIDVSNRFDDVLGVGPRAFDKTEAARLIGTLHEFVSAAFSDIPEFDRDRRKKAVGGLMAESRRFGDMLAAQFSAYVVPAKSTKEDRRSYFEFIDRYDSSMVSLPGWDMNDLFGELYWYFQKHKLKNDRPADAFSRMAGISRSAIVEYQRRQLTPFMPSSAAAPRS